MKFYHRLIFSLLILLFIFMVFYQQNNTREKLRKLESKLKLKHDEIFISRNEKCTLKLHNKNVEHIFQSVHPNEFLPKTYIYSAYYDHRSTPKVKIISLIEQNTLSFYCIVWFSSNSTRTVRATVTSIPEGSNRRFNAAFINCPLGQSNLPLFVSVVTNLCDPILNFVKVDVIPKSNLSRTFSVCVSPFNLAFNKVDQLIEMLSINELLGASHIYFYNYSTGPDVVPILAAYVRRQFVTVVPWPLPMKVHVWPIPPNYQEEIKYFGQMAMLNDCLMRNMGRYKHVVFTDLDEFLVPRQARNWSELFAGTIELKYGQGMGGWLFRNVFFKTEWPSDPAMAANVTIANLKSMSLVKVRRESMIYPPYQRSKMILDPLAVDVVGVHNVWAFCDGKGMAVLTPEEGLCHHYRFWAGMGEKTFVEDRNLLRLREDLVRVISRNRKIYL